MRFMRHLIVMTVIVALATPAAAQSRLKLPDPVPFQQSQFQQSRAVVSAALHPAAKGALIGAGVGAGTLGAIGIWYCTAGPSEEGECGNENWVGPFALWAAAGAGIGALIGVLANRR
jgi:hypothetical protein